MSDFLNSISSGLVANIIFAVLLIWGFQQLRYWYYLRRKFHNQTFHTYWKRFTTEIVQTVTCKVRGNVMKFSGSRVRDEDLFEGEFIMNPLNLKIGEGFHIHKNSDGFAFLKVIIKDADTLFVEAPYTKIVEDEKKRKKRSRVYQAFVWRKIQEDKASEFKEPIKLNIEELNVN